ncbi:phospholipase D [Macrolepiota fuliginosa MF-IS2]|uniref:phospholipase D n=1 Tax=Macrolepiota fuliginosa MF-IS2 TaxID=1400762 RepID=A0A9P5XST8_9AGAR|nr:phospholipase D [Macrolepiota fuliginosa MF-IS2]
MGDWAGCHSTCWDANAPTEQGERELTNQFTKSGYPLGIMVNSQGERFVDEGEDFRNYTYAKFGRAVLAQPQGFAFQIWDSKMVSNLRQEEYGDGVVEKIYAGTLEELAEKLFERGLEPVAREQLVKTIQGFNVAVKAYHEQNTGIQWDPAVKDGKGTSGLPLPKSNWALTIDEPPFLAVKVACGITFTFGGLAVDPVNACVVNEQGNKIEGLYCTGEMVGGLFYGNYPGGSGLTAGAVFGRKAGQTGLVQDAITHHRQRPLTSPDNAGPSASSHHSRASPSPVHGHDGDNGVQPTNVGPVLSEYLSVGGASDHGQFETQSHDSRGQDLSPRPSPYKSPPDTPATRTGPPRSLPYAYSYSFSNSPSRHNSGHQLDSGDLHPTFSYDNADVSFSQTSTEFRGALESLPSRDQFSNDRKGKRRESRSVEDGWNPIRWFQESPKEEHSRSTIPWRSTGPESIREEGENATTLETCDEIGEEGGQHPDGRLEPSVRRLTGDEHRSAPASQPRKNLRRALSLPHTPGKAKWAKLRSLIPNLQTAHDQGGVDLAGPSVAVTSPAVNITDELITGGLSTLMLRLWFERDEKGHRRVPILLHRLRIRISDSYYPVEEKRTAFRIECEYANGVARWVIYRQLRDFFSLHTHYRVSNVYNRLGDKLPEFPLTSIPYLKFLKKEGIHIDQASFARLQREALETYLINLIGAVMFHPSSNRLSGFLEVSALSISLAQSGGVQYKGGFLQIHAVNNGGAGFGRKGTNWGSRKESRWASIRDSYLVVVDEPGELTVWDVFLFDPDFKIERPKRYYRQGLNNILHNDFAMIEHHISSPDRPQAVENSWVGQNDLQPNHQHLQPHDNHHNSDGLSLLGSVRSRISRIFHSDNGHNPRSKVQKSQGNETVDDSDSSDTVSLPPRTRTPMLDPSIHVDPMAVPGNQNYNTENQQVDGSTKEKKAEDVSKHTFYIVNSQMRLKLFARNERQMLQWITAFEKSASSSPYTNRNRFDSFAPIRLNVAAQWLVDGRDYFWNLSRAILLAREVIYIHDWWLSPELLMRRPNKERYRLDYLLERKAKEGVKIYVILYQEVSNRTTPTDSHYAKQRLMGLHPNIMVQRSPSHFQTGTFYWAHHEKVCVIDQAIGFMGGIDLCFGRWDTPQHVLVDDVDGTDRPEIWPGKDYSNPRISDFYNLNKPEENMYDRTQSPRMPWHDVAMQVVGQPARDLARHFNHTRMMPFLLPPPEFKPGELTQMGLTGTCEMQICRSAGPWSMGTPTKTEHSIQNAYLKAIQMSEHFVYIENQFFITSTIVNDVKVENNIGDAIVHRIIKAHRDGTPWKCCIIIPLLPGFTFPVDHSDASAVRQQPDEYISVFSLRNWAKMRGDVLTTEQVYIHGKVCIVDDRLAIIGSANINERSQRGDRDSEVAAVIRDTDMIDGTMAGQPFKVGRFAHTLRVRLMREHLGVDVDALDEEDLMAGEPTHMEQEQQYRQNGGIMEHDQCTIGGASLKAGLGNTNQEHGDLMKAKARSGLVASEVLTAEEKIITDNCPLPSQASSASECPQPDILSCPRTSDDVETANSVKLPEATKTEIRSPPMGTLPNEHGEDLEGSSAQNTIQRQRTGKSGTKWTVSTSRPRVNPDGFEDPISDAFWKNVWVVSATYNTEIYRKVFHAIPDDTVTTWKRYKEFVAYHDRLRKSTAETGEPTARIPSEARNESTLNLDNTLSPELNDGSSEGENGSEHQHLPPVNPPNDDERTRKPAKGTEPFQKWERDEMERLLKDLNGHLVTFPTRFLESEDTANNFLFNADKFVS